MGTGKAGHRDSGSFTIAVRLKISFGKRVLSLPTSKLVDPAVIGGKVGFEGSRQRELVKCGGLKCPGLALPAALSPASRPSPRWSHVRPCSLLPGGLESSYAAFSPAVSHRAPQGAQSHSLPAAQPQPLGHVLPVPQPHCCKHLSEIRSHRLPLFKILQQLCTASRLKFRAVASPPSCPSLAVAITRGGELQLHRLELRTGP